MIKIKVVHWDEDVNQIGDTDMLLIDSDSTTVEEILSSIKENPNRESVREMQSLAGGIMEECERRGISCSFDHYKVDYEVSCYADFEEGSYESVSITRRDNI